MIVAASPSERRPTATLRRRARLAVARRESQHVQASTTVAWPTPPTIRHGFILRWPTNGKVNLFSHFDFFRLILVLVDPYSAPEAWKVRSMPKYRVPKSTIIEISTPHPPNGGVTRFWPSYSKLLLGLRLFTSSQVVWRLILVPVDHR